MRRPLFAVVGLAVGLFGGAGAAGAFISANTIDAHVTYKGDGTRVRATGPVGCTRGERIGIRATIMQSTTGARARSAWRGRCTGEVQHWRIQAPSRRGTRFENGNGRVCAVGKTRKWSGLTDTRRWCEPVRVSGGFR